MIQYIFIAVSVINIVMYLLAYTKDVLPVKKVIIHLVIQMIIGLIVNRIVAIIYVVFIFTMYNAMFGNKVSFVGPLVFMIIISIFYVAIKYTFFTKEIDFDYIKTLGYIIPGIIIMYCESKLVTYEKEVTYDSKNS